MDSNYRFRREDRVSSLGLLLARDRGVGADVSVQPGFVIIMPSPLEANSLGNLGGFFGPWYVGVIKDRTDSYAGGLYGLAFLCVMSALVCALFLHIPNPTVTRGRTAALAAE